MEKKLTSLLTIMVVAVTFVFCFAVASDDVYVSAKSKKYHLPKEITVIQYDDEGNISSGLSKIKYDKYGNMKSALVSEAIPVQFNMKYRNKKGVISSLKFGDGTDMAKKTFDKKGRLKTVKVGSDTYKYKTDKKGIIKKVTLNGKKHYSVKKISFQKNGFVSSVTYSNGNVNKYNKYGLISSVKLRNGVKFTYKYTRKNGKVVKMTIKRDGKLYKKITVKYGKSTTKDLWKFSCVVAYADGPSYANELYSKTSLGGANSAPWGRG